MRHTLYISRATAKQVFDFISGTQSILFNCVWPMTSPYDEPMTHNVYCELIGGDLRVAREKLAAVANQATPGLDWEIMPDRP